MIGKCCHLSANSNRGVQENGDYYDLQRMRKIVHQVHSNVFQASAKKLKVVSTKDLNAGKLNTFLLGKKSDL